MFEKENIMKKLLIISMALTMSIATQSSQIEKVKKTIIPHTLIQTGDLFDNSDNINGFALHSTPKKKDLIVLYSTEKKEYEISEVTEGKPFHVYGDFYGSELIGDNNVILNLDNVDNTVFFPQTYKFEDFPDIENFIGTGLNPTGGFNLVGINEKEKEIVLVFPGGKKNIIKYSKLRLQQASPRKYFTRYYGTIIPFIRYLVKNDKGHMDARVLFTNNGDIAQYPYPNTMKKISDNAYNSLSRYNGNIYAFTNKIPRIHKHGELYYTQRISTYLRKEKKWKEYEYDFAGIVGTTRFFGTSPYILINKSKNEPIGVFDCLENDFIEIEGIDYVNEFLCSVGYYEVPLMSTSARIFFGKEKMTYTLWIMPNDSNAYWFGFIIDVKNKKVEEVFTQESEFSFVTVYPNCSHKQLVWYKEQDEENIVRIINLDGDEDEIFESATLKNIGKNKFYENINVFIKNKTGGILKMAQFPQVYEIEYSKQLCEYISSADDFVYSHESKICALIKNQEDGLHKVSFFDCEDNIVIQVLKNIKKYQFIQDTYNEIKYVVTSDDGDSVDVWHINEKKVELIEVSENENGSWYKFWWT